MNNISRVLIANRGEIAVRIIKACRELGIESVLAVSDVDRDSLPARMADRAVCIGPARPRDSYLKVEAIVTAALGTGSQAVHPGYGFLAEQPALAETCEKYGLRFIGPDAKCIRQMGNKLLSREISNRLGVPVIPGSYEVRDYKGALSAGKEIGLPFLIKAAGGGGGRGIKVITDFAALKETFEIARQEAAGAFSDPTLYIERYVPNARHIEVQVLGDHSDKVIHVGERDCSLQRRYQKIIEETPAYSINESIREQICAAGVTLARGVGYKGAGTVEFIVDDDNGQVYFMEMNTRIQVEHPITEMVTGVDLVKEQIRIADGQPLSLNQEDIRPAGHAIECRVNSESSDGDFRPCPGRISGWKAPEGPGIRVDTHCYPGYLVLPYYDSLLAKVIVWGSDRDDAILRMRGALESFFISGVDTTIPFLLSLLNDARYVQGKVNTRWVESMVPTIQAKAIAQDTPSGGNLV